jgi:predicted ATP-grasp superfamily ATP-dependent carboligase
VICYAIGALSLPVNLIVKNIKVDNFAFVGAINLEKKDKNEFINKLMDWCEDKFNVFTVMMNKEDPEDEFDNDHILER